MLQMLMLCMNYMVNLSKLCKCVSATSGILTVHLRIHIQCLHIPAKVCCELSRF